MIWNSKKSIPWISLQHDNNKYYFILRDRNSTLTSVGSSPVGKVWHVPLAQEALVIIVASLASICGILPRGENDDDATADCIRGFRGREDALERWTMLLPFFASKTMFIVGLVSWPMSEKYTWGFMLIQQRWNSSFGMIWNTNDDCQMCQNQSWI